MEMVVALLPLIVAVAGSLIAKALGRRKPTNVYAPDPGTGEPQPKPDEVYPEPQPDPEDDISPPAPEPDPEPEAVPQPEPAPEPEPEPAPQPDPYPEPEPEPEPQPAPVPTPAPKPSGPRVYTAAEQDAFLKAVGLPHGTPERRKSSWDLWQAATIWPDFDGKMLVADGDCGARTTYVAEYSRTQQSYRISRFFHLYEFRCKGQDAAQGSGRYCKNCKIIHIERELVARLDRVREEIYKGPMSITTGYRCEGYNAHVGGIKGSAHTLGVGADIPRKHSWRKFLGYGFRGIGKSRVDRESVVHVDLAAWLGLDHVFQE
jgi:hypothetical protein